MRALHITDLYGGHAVGLACGTSGFFGFSPSSSIAGFALFLAEIDGANGRQLEFCSEGIADAELPSDPVGCPMDSAVAGLADEHFLRSK